MVFDLNMTELVKSFGGKLGSEFMDFLNDRAHVAEGERKRELEQCGKDVESIQKAVAAADRDIAQYRARRLARITSTRVKG